MLLCGLKNPKNHYVLDCVYDFKFGFGDDVHEKATLNTLNLYPVDIFVACFLINFCCMDWIVDCVFSFVLCEQDIFGFKAEVKRSYGGFGKFALGGSG